MHQSKGLQYPVVHLPFASMNFVRSVDVARYHDDAGTRMVDVAGGGADWSAHERAHLTEEAGEELRDLYVALTRAQSQVVTWWAPTRNTPDGGLHRLLFGRQPGAGRGARHQGVKDDDYAARILGLLAELGGPSPEVSAVADERPRRRRPAKPARPGGARLRPRGRHRVAPHVVLRADPGAGAARAGSAPKPRASRRTTSRRPSAA